MSQLTGAADDVRRPPPATAAPGERGENFPVALRVLPASLRRDLHAVYGFARGVDELGDNAPGDRTAALAGFEADLRRVWTAVSPTDPILAALVPTVRAHDLPIEPFLALVEANQLDQVRSTYETWADLRHYCTLSADPVGRIVLGVLEVRDPDGRLTAWSDDVCTALQVLEHCQDVAEDRGRGRTYLPQEDLERFGVTDSELGATTTSPAVRAVVGYEVQRARELLAAGRPLVRSLHGAGRLAVAGFVAGGLATADALQRADYDVLATVPKPGKAATARHALRLLAGRP
ncbi:MAG TPA: squalene synthase HpnC [Mycobacteriales bacterium]|nr:squalene synthase HpnC [Mycobacteriales bacterium]